MHAPTAGKLPGAEERFEGRVRVDSSALVRLGRVCFFDGGSVMADGAVCGRFASLCPRGAKEKYMKNE